MSKKAWFFAVYKNMQLYFFTKNVGGATLKNLRRNLLKSIDESMFVCYNNTQETYVCKQVSWMDKMDEIFRRF